MVNKEIKIKYLYIIDYLLAFILIKYYSLRDTSIFLLLSLKVPSFWKSTSNIPKKPYFLQITESLLESTIKFRSQMCIKLPSHNLYIVLQQSFIFVMLMRPKAIFCIFDKLAGQIMW